MSNVNYAYGGNNHTKLGGGAGRVDCNAQPDEIFQGNNIVTASNLVASIINRNPRARRMSCPDLELSRTSSAPHSPIGRGLYNVYHDISDDELFEEDNLKLDFFCYNVKKRYYSFSLSQIERALFPKNGKAHDRVFDVLIKHASNDLQNDWIDRVLSDADVDMRRRAFRSLVEHACEVNKKFGGKEPEYSSMMPVTAADLWRSARPNLVEYVKESECSSWVQLSACYESDIEEASSLEGTSSYKWAKKETLYPEITSHRLTDARIERALSDTDAKVRGWAILAIAKHTPQYLTDARIERALSDSDAQVRRWSIMTIAEHAPQYLTDSRIDRALQDANETARVRALMAIVKHAPQYLTDARIDHALQDANAMARSNAFCYIVQFVPDRLTSKRIDCALSDKDEFAGQVNSGCLIRYAPALLTPQRIDNFERSTGPLNQVYFLKAAKSLGITMVADHLNQLPSEQLSQLDGRLFSALTDEVLAELDAKVLNGLTDTNKAKLGIRVFARVSDGTFKALDENITNNIINNIIKNIDDALSHTDVAVRKEAFGLLARRASHRLTNAQLDRALFNPEVGGARQAYIDMAAHAPELLETWIDRAVLDADIGRRRYVVSRLVSWAPNHATDVRIERALTDTAAEVRIQTFIDLAESAPQHLTDVRIDRALTDTAAEVRIQAFINLAASAPQHLTDARVDRAMSDSVAWLRTFVSGCLIRYAPTLLTAKRIDDFLHSTGPLDQDSFLKSLKGIGITMTADHLNQLPSEQFAQLDGRLFSALSDEVLSKLDAKVLNGLTDSNKAKLDTRVLAKVSDETFRALDKSILKHKSAAAAWALNPGYIMRYIYRPENFHGISDERKQIIAKS